MLAPVVLGSGHPTTALIYRRGTVDRIDVINHG